MEGVAYLNARIRLKMDEQFPVFTQYLLDSLYPHYLATTPAMGIIAIYPKADAGLKEGVVHPRGSALVASLGGDATLPVQFRTGFDVTLWPIKVGGVEYLPSRAAVASATDGAPGEAALRIRLDATSAAAIAEMGIDALDLFFDGGGDTPNLVHQQVLSECTGVRVVAPERGRRTAWLEPAGMPQAMGFGEDEALLPNEARSFRGLPPARRIFCVAREVPLREADRVEGGDGAGGQGGRHRHPVPPRDSRSRLGRCRPTPSSCSRHR